MVAPVALQVGSLAIHWYGLILAAAMAAAWQVARRVAPRTGALAQHIDGLVPWIVILSLVGARLGEVFIFEPSYYLANPGQIFAIWNGGLSIMGGIAGGIAAVAWYSYRRKLQPWSYMDAAAVALPLGQAIGRWGNFFNQELYGRPTSFPWAITIDPSHRMPGYEQFSTFQPLFLYESALDLLLFLILWQVSKRSLRPGKLTWLYIAGYGLIRFAMEFGRIDPAVPVATLRLPQLIAAAMVVAGVLGWWRTRPDSNRRSSP